jgi:5-methylcytosine-specific restriction endonuclease McrA
MSKILKSSKYKKKNIPKAIREQCWLQTMGKIFEHKCYITWCNNTINVFDFHVGHDKPESKGGNLSIDNLKPICSRCNQSMSNNYTIEEWNKLCPTSNDNKNNKNIEIKKEKCNFGCFKI